jgi:hypothetical protein
MNILHPHQRKVATPTEPTAKPRKEPFAWLASALLPSAGADVGCSFDVMIVFSFFQHAQASLVLLSLAGLVCISGLPTALYTPVTAALKEDNCKPAMQPMNDLWLSICQKRHV